MTIGNILWFVQVAGPAVRVCYSDRRGHSAIRFRFVRTPTVIAATASMLLVALFCLTTGQAQAPNAGNDLSNATLVYVGTYTGAKSRGIYLFRLQTGNAGASQDVTLLPLGLAAETSNPSYLDIDY